MKHTRNVAVALLCGIILSGCGDNSSNGEFEYVALGASDATGVGATPFTEGYVFEIQNELEKDGRDVGLLNLGIPGAESDEIRNLEVPVAIEEEPELITITVGGNDIVNGVSIEDFLNDVSGMLSDLTSKTDAVIVIATIPNLTQLPRFLETPKPEVTLARVQQFNAVIIDQARIYGVPVVDLFNQDINAFVVTDDGFHPNDAGHQLIADLFLGTIRPLIAE
jgi:lysophospholipase L1-like esterase